MSVHPGFGGQAFIPEVLDKIAVARAEIDERGATRWSSRSTAASTSTTAPLAAEAGADILVAGSAVFRADDPAAAARRSGPPPTVPDTTVTVPVARRPRCWRLRRRRRRHARRQRRTQGGGAPDRSRLRGARARGHPRRHRRGCGRAPPMADGFAGLVVTTGGTGFGPRDLTPGRHPSRDRARGARLGRGDAAGQRRRRAAVRHARTRGVRHHRCGAGLQPARARASGAVEASR